MKGYKGFDKDLKCKEFQYEVGKTYELDGKIELCERGFHFCKELIDVMNYYNTKKGNRFCKVEAIGEVLEDEVEKKCCTNKIKIIREIPIEEVLKKVNTGYRNTGNHNTGDYNTGDYNTGDYNTGYCNTGDRNTGDYNTGNYNTGNYNTGYRNTGNHNTGDRNTGNHNTGNHNTGYCNTGYYNTGNHNTGLFNTDEPCIRMFNKETNLKRENINIWRISNILSFIDKREEKLIWKYTEEMTAEEKAQYPEYTTIGGALMKVKIKVDAQTEWEKVSKEDKEFIKNLPNFDPVIFKEITGIEVN